MDIELKQKRRNDKWIAGILSVVFPGLGHFYLGQLGRGFIFMGAFILHIVLIVFFTLSIGFFFPMSIALITFFGLTLAVLYFFNIFDGLQSVDRKYTYRVKSGFPSRRSIGTPRTGLILIVVGCAILVTVLLPSGLWSWIFNHFQTLVALLLLVSGGWLLWTQWANSKEDRS